MRACSFSTPRGKCDSLFHRGPDPTDASAKGQYCRPRSLPAVRRPRPRSSPPAPAVAGQRTMDEPAMEAAAGLVEVAAPAGAIEAVALPAGELPAAAVGDCGQMQQGSIRG